MKKTRGLSSLPDECVYGEMDSPVGKLTIVTSKKGLHAILWDSDVLSPKFDNAAKGLKKVTSDKVLLQTKKQLKEYFAGKRKKFDLPVVIKGTDFQVKCWKQLLKIPYAKTCSYGEQATKVGDKKAARAVGMANGRNPISIVVPCHRVIGASGHLTGFGGGLDNKAFLLDLEKGN